MGEGFKFTLNSYFFNYLNKKKLNLFILNNYKIKQYF